MAQDLHRLVTGFDIDAEQFAQDLRTLADAIEEGDAALVGVGTHQDAEQDDPIEVGHTATYHVPENRTDLLPTVPLNDGHE
jgi:hypothetical protein